MKRVLLLFLLLICAFSVPAQNPFDTLRNCREEDRSRLAIDIYYGRVVILDSAGRTNAVDSFGKMAEAFHNVKLQVLETLFRGEFFYGIWRGECLLYFKKGLELAEKHQFNDLGAQALHDLGLQYYRQGKYNPAFEHLLRANYFMKDYGYSKYPWVSRYLTELGEVYWFFGDYEKGKQLLEDAAKFPSPNAVYSIRLYNTLGLCNRELGNLEAAKDNFINTITIAQQANKVRWIGTATGNLGSTYFKMEKYYDAIAMLTIDYEQSLKDGINPFNCLCMLAEIYVKKSKPDSAAWFLNKATATLAHEATPRTYRSYYNAKAGYFRLKGDYDNALRCIDSVSFYDGALLKADLTNIKSKAEQKAAVEKYLADMQLVESKQETRVITRNAIITALILFLIIAGLGLRNLWLRRKSDREKLANAGEQLNLYIENVREKTGLIEQLEEKLQSVDIHQNNQETITQLHNYTILTEDDWNQFRKLFEKVHFNFFVKLKQKYPSLTPAEVRLMALIKLNLGKKEIANMLGISPDSVNRTRQRLKKKIELPEDKDLEEVAFNI